MSKEADDRRKEQQAARKAKERAKHRDIKLSFISKPNKRRRTWAEKSLKKWCETYLADRFPLAWAPYHLMLFSELQRIITEGGRQAIGAPRGGGKSGITEAAVLWGVMTGLHPYVVLVTASGTLAPKTMASIKMAFNEEKLLQDYEEVCRPLVEVGGIAIRCRGMTYGEDPVWATGSEQPLSAKRIVLPTIPGSKCSGAVIEACGLLEATRGLKFAYGGKLIRPSLVLLDDPQTEASAKSAVQCENRLSAISRGIGQLGGPQEDVAILGTLTVVEPGDVAHRLLDRKEFPEWHGIKIKMLESWPLGCDPRKPHERAASEEAVETAKLWEEYGEIYKNDLANGDPHSKLSTSFYRRNRHKMDRGAAASWPQRKPHCLSAIEYAMRLWIKDPSVFLSEMQNDPGLPAPETIRSLTARDILQNTNGLVRYQVPLGSTHGTFFIDCHDKLLYYTVIFWKDQFTGYIVDYGTWPEQPGRYYEQKHARKTIAKDPRITSTTDVGRLVQALGQLTSELVDRRWITEDGSEAHLELGLVDAGWKTTPVYDFCAQARRRYGIKVLPIFGRPFTPVKAPISTWIQKKQRAIIGDEWALQPRAAGRPIRHVIADANRRKMFAMQRLTTPHPDPGCVSLYHENEAHHRLFADHLTAEKGIVVDCPYGELVQYSLFNKGQDNHYLDCVVGAITAQSMLGGKIDMIGLALGKHDPPPKDTTVKEVPASTPVSDGPASRVRRVPHKKVMYMEQLS